MRKDSSYPRSERLSSATPRSKGTLASDFVGNVIFTFSRSRNLNLTSFDDKLRKDELFGLCEFWGLHLLLGVLEATKSREKLRSNLLSSWPCQLRWLCQLRRHPLCNRLQSNLRSCHDAVVTKSLRSRRTEGLSDKCFLHGKFSENQALLRVRSLKFAFSQWYFVGNGLDEHICSVPN